MRMLGPGQDSKRPFKRSPDSEAGSSRDLPSHARLQVSMSSLLSAALPWSLWLLAGPVCLTDLRVVADRLAPGFRSRFSGERLCEPRSIWLAAVANGVTWTNPGAGAHDGCRG